MSKSTERDAGQRHDRANREVDAPSDDDERHPGGDDSNDGALLNDVDQVRRRAEVRRGDPECYAKKEEPGEGSDFSPHAAPIAHARRLSCVASVRANSPAIVPPRITSTRSESPTISGSSDEIMTIPIPVAASLLINA